MKLGIVNMTRTEYSDNNIAIRDYKISLFGIPIYVARFTTTNRDAIKLLATVKQNKTYIRGFK